jgi:hypothetical protein
MNAGLTLATILSLLLTLAASGDTTKPQASVGNSPASGRDIETQHNETLVRDQGTRGHNLNHNETLVRETVPARKIGSTCSPLVCGSNHNETLVRDAGLIRKGGFTCSPIVCGSNHNETLVRDTQFEPSIGGGCSPMVCGSNHNETLVRDAVPSQPDELSLWLSGEQAFSAAPLLSQFLIYRAGGQCSPLICGSNHNETLVRDAALLK